MLKNLNETSRPNPDNGHTHLTQMQLACFLMRGEWQAYTHSYMAV